MKRIALALALTLAASPALAWETSWTDGGGTTYYRTPNGGIGSSYQDRTGQTHYGSTEGMGKAWQDGGGVTHYEGTTPYSYDR